MSDPVLEHIADVIAAQNAELQSWLVEAMGLQDPARLGCLTTVFYGRLGTPLRYGVASLLNP